MLQGDLLALAVKFVCARSGGADAAGGRDAAELEFGLGGGGEIEEDVLADYRHVALEQALFVRMPEHWLRRFIGLFSDAASIALPRHETDAPAIRFRL